MLEQQVDTDRSNLHVALLLLLYNSFDVRLQDAERTELAVFVHDRLNRWDLIQLLKWKLFSALDIAIACDV